MPNTPGMLLVLVTGEEKVPETTFTHSTERYLVMVSNSGTVTVNAYSSLPGKPTSSSQKLPSEAGASLCRAKPLTKLVSMQVLPTGVFLTLQRPTRPLPSTTA